MYGETFRAAAHLSLRRALRAYTALHLLPKHGTAICGASEVETLKDKTKSELLAYDTGGAREYIRNDYKLDIPECIISATEQYQQENDWLTDFFNEWVALDKNEDTYGSDIYGAYTSFCSEHGERLLPMSSVLPLVATKAGATKKRTKKGNVYQGLRIISEFERAAS